MAGTELVERSLGVLIDGSHTRAYELDLAIIRLAESHGWQSGLDVDALTQTLQEYGDPEASEIAYYASQEAVDWLNDELPIGYAFSVEESCLRLDPITDEEM